MFEKVNGPLKCHSNFLGVIYIVYNIYKWTPAPRISSDTVNVYAEGYRLATKELRENQARLHKEGRGPGSSLLQKCLSPRIVNQGFPFNVHLSLFLRKMT